jgi:hypothetical protein
MEQQLFIYMSAKFKEYGKEHIVKCISLHLAVTGNGFGVFLTVLHF